MIGKFFLPFLLVLTSCFSSVQKLPNVYRISYGDPGAPIQVTEYFSFSCPSCSQLFAEDFAYFKEKYIDTGKVFWTFHPYPMDQSTVQALHFLESMENEEKQSFLESTLPKMRGAKTQEAIHLMANVMKHVTQQRTEALTVADLKKTAAFVLGFGFVKTNPEIKDVPTIEINGVIYDWMPKKAILEKKFQTLLLGDSK